MTPEELSALIIQRYESANESNVKPAKKALAELEEKLIREYGLDEAI